MSLADTPQHSPSSSPSSAVSPPDTFTPAQVFDTLPPRVLDALTRGVFVLALTLERERVLLRAPAEDDRDGRKRVRELARLDAQIGDDDTTRAALSFGDTFGLLDSLAQLGVDTHFPYPGSPRLDGVGGGKKIAPDGSPGVPASWVKWMMQPRVYDEQHDKRSPHAPLLLSIAWLQRYEPDLWRIYAERVLESCPVTLIASREKRSTAAIYRILTRARVLLLAQIAYFTGATSSREYATLLHMIAEQQSAERVLSEQQQQQQREQQVQRDVRAREST